MRVISHKLILSNNETLIQTIFAGKTRQWKSYEQHLCFRDRRGWWEGGKRTNKTFPDKSLLINMQHAHICTVQKTDGIGLKEKWSQLARC